MKNLSAFHNIHRDAAIIVCGCGESLNKLDHPEEFITIGVNDVGRRFQPTYLVVVNPRNQFSGDRFRYVETSTARAIFTQLDLGLSHPNVMKFCLGKYGGTDFSDPNVLHYAQNSPYVALCLASHMGSKRLGLIGVDFTDHHFFARTGTHALAAQLRTIDEQYRRLAAALRLRRVEVFNLSPESRITAFPKMDIESFRTLSATDSPQRISASAESKAEQSIAKKRLFFINYKFLSCGEVFTDGLRNAARSLEIPFEDAYWDDGRLPAKIAAFKPDWLFVVHGRRFVQRWRNSFSSIKKAVWLLDEPYEVDDTSKWSRLFDVVYVNDPSTLDRHRNAYYLPVAYDAEVHRETGEPRRYQAGFIGGHNETRERYLLSLQKAGHLSYVVGGPWRSPALRRICIAANIPAPETASLYRQTRIVINVFRDLHHFNRQRTQPYSMNPRIYEALACGAVVVSEARAELPALLPEVPLFSDPGELVDAVDGLVTDEQKYRHLKQTCLERVRSHTYRERMLRIFETLDCPASLAPNHKGSHKEVAMEQRDSGQHCPALSIEGWELCGEAVKSSDGDSILLSKAHDNTPGAEQGLATAGPFRDVELSFEVNISEEACFIAKVHQAGQFDQTTNSYHLFCHPSGAYLARHNHVFRTAHVRRDRWQRITLRRCNDRVDLEIDGAPAARVVDGMLESGYCFVGIKGGRVLLRNLTARSLTGSANSGEPAREGAAGPDTNGMPKYEILHISEQNTLPAVSIITTVYDRVHCLAECVRSVNNLQYRDIEHIIVSDHPSEPVVDRILSSVRSEAAGSVTYANLDCRFNNWGITPASVGLHLARGRYVCFLSDDNGYTSDHFNPLVAVLDQDSSIGFAYSSCQYAGRLLLRNPTPRPGGIDLGQPLFRKEIFDRYMPGVLPFNMMAWDWHMIETFMRHGVKWRHIDRASFLFRLAACSRRTYV